MVSDMSKLKRQLYLNVALLPGKLRWSGRRQIAAGYPKLALTPRSLEKSQHRLRFAPQRDSDVVRSGRYIFEMEIIRAKFSSLDPWETSVVVQSLRLCGC